MTTNFAVTHAPAHLSDARPGRALGALLIFTALLSFAPLAVLGSAFGWPASLSAPAAEQLAAIHANPGALRLGYGLYLLYSILMAPVMIGLASCVLGSVAPVRSAVVSGFATLSTLARAIGIARWLTVMPALASAHAAADAPTRAQIELLFDAVTKYGGGIGELLGVGLFMSLSLGQRSALRRQTPNATVRMVAARVPASSPRCCWPA